MYLNIYLAPITVLISTITGNKPETGNLILVSADLGRKAFPINDSMAGPHVLVFPHIQTEVGPMTQNQSGNWGAVIRNLLINTISIFAVSYILKGIEIDTFTTALIVAVVMAVLNVTLKPFLILITIPLTVVTFGLFLLVVNVLVLYAAGALIDGFHIAGFWWALAFSLLVSFVNSILMGPKQR